MALVDLVVFLRVEDAARRGLHAEHREEVARHHLGLEPLGLVVDADRGARPAPADHLGQRLGALLDTPGRSDTSASACPCCCRCGALLVEHHQLLGGLHRQLAQGCGSQGARRTSRWSWSPWTGWTVPTVYRGQSRAGTPGIPEQVPGSDSPPLRDRVLSPDIRTRCSAQNAVTGVACAPAGRGLRPGRRPGRFAPPVARRTDVNDGDVSQSTDRAERCLRGVPVLDGRGRLERARAA